MLFWDISWVQTSVLLKFYGPGMCRNRPDVGNIFMQCLHLLRRYFVPLPWRFLTQPELQQGWDQFNCNQKRFLMLHAIKINCIYINEQVAAYFHAICAPIRSWSDISGQHFPSLPPGELCFWRRAGGPKFCTGSSICTSSKFCLVPATWWRCPQCLP